MGKPRGFMEIPRVDPGYRPIAERVKDYDEVERRLDADEITRQAARCMDCGVPFCHGSGCPLRNVIPEFNELVYAGYWRDALDVLLSTNNFPEFTGRVCPALCEAACTAGLGDAPVSIRQIELSLIERAFDEGYLKPSPPEKRFSKRVAVIGSGPAGLAVADQLNKMGYPVTVFEKDRFVGGLLRYGIPDFKLAKSIVQRRIDLMTAEGITFETDLVAGDDVSAQYLRKRFDAICLACGCRAPRDLPIPGRDLKGVHFAMDFLVQQNCRVNGEDVADTPITANGKRVVVIGGGDTGSDCVGTSIRQGAKSVLQLEILPKPPDERHASTPWPAWPYQLRGSSSHQEGCERQWNVMTKRFEGKNGVLRKIVAVEVEWDEDADGKPSTMREIPNSEFSINADLALLAMGFSGPGGLDLLKQLGVEFDDRGNVAVNSNGMTSESGVFAAGDLVTGASLVVRAIASGRELSFNVHEFLQS